MLYMLKNVIQTKCSLVVLKEDVNPTDTASVHNHSVVRKYKTHKIFQQKGFNMGI